jgi:divalent metal cation (Fe/Co/Zn/Cd) transporter
VSAGGGTKAIVAALLANAGIAVSKFIGYGITGSSSMLAEAVHSVADTSNQGLLLLGQKRARREATQAHPFGYGRDRYFYSFVVALLLFSLGSVFALYEGFHKLETHEPLTSPLVAVVILVVAIGLEILSFRTAIILIIETKSLLIGEGSGPAELGRIHTAMVGGGVDRVIHIKTQYLGPDELLIAAKIAVPAAMSTAEVAQIINEAETRIRSAVPAARVIYLEPDLDRTPAASR